MQAVVLAGGLGTRLGPLTDNLPKALVPVNGVPFLDYQLDLLSRSGIRDVVLCVGHLGDRIKGHLSDAPGLDPIVRFSEERNGLLGTAGAIRNAQRLLANEFFLTYGDGYLQLDYQAIMDFFQKRDELGLMVVYRNRDNIESSNVVIKGDLVTIYDKSGLTPAMEHINYGVSLLRKGAVDLIPAGGHFSQEEFYQQLINRRQLLAYETDQRFYEIGSPAGLREFELLVKTEGMTP